MSIFPTTFYKTVTSSSKLDCLFYIYNLYELHLITPIQKDGWGAHSRRRKWQEGDAGHWWEWVNSLCTHVGSGQSQGFDHQGPVYFLNGAAANQLKLHLRSISWFCSHVLPYCSQLSLPTSSVVLVHCFVLIINWAFVLCIHRFRCEVCSRESSEACIGLLAES